MERKLRVIIFEDRGWWVAQCLEYDIAAQARTIKDVQNEFQRLFIGRICTARKLNVAPFDGIPAAPDKYHKMFGDTKKTLRVELKPIENMPSNIPPAFMLPSEAVLYAY